MNRITLTPQAQDDLIRLTEFLFERDPLEAVRTADLIRDALLILQQQPRIGRPVPPRLRELVIHRGRTGYLALYRLSADERAIEVLAIRHQRESGYHEDDL